MATVDVAMIEKIILGECDLATRKYHRFAYIHDRCGRIVHTSKFDRDTVNVPAHYDGNNETDSDHETTAQLQESHEK